FTRLAEKGQNYLLGGQQLVWLHRLAEDQDNMHAAVRGAVAAGDARAAVRLAAALGWYWSLSGLKVEGAELIAAAIGVPGAAGVVEPEHLAVAYHVVAADASVPAVRPQQGGEDADRGGLARAVWGPAGRRPCR